MVRRLHNQVHSQQVFLQRSHRSVQRHNLLASLLGSQRANHPHRRQRSQVEGRQTDLQRNLSRLQVRSLHQNHHVNPLRSQQHNLLDFRALNLLLPQVHSRLRRLLASLRRNHPRTPAHNQRDSLRLCQPISQLEYRPCSRLLSLLRNPLDSQPAGQARCLPGSLRLIHRRSRAVSQVVRQLPSPSPSRRYTQRRSPQAIQLPRQLVSPQRSQVGDQLAGQLAVLLGNPQRCHRHNQLFLHPLYRALSQHHNHRHVRRHSQALNLLRNLPNALQACRVRCPPPSQAPRLPRLLQVS